VFLAVAFLANTPPFLDAASVRVTTWNLEWFPNGSKKELPTDQQEQRIKTAAGVLRPLNSDIILLQEVQDYDVCVRLAEAIQPRTYHVAIVSAFKEPFQPGLGKQQVAILAKEPAQAAWSESWKSMEGVDPPRGFVFAWFKIAGNDVGVYSLHLKSNLVMRGDKATEMQKNIRKREVAAAQLLNHVRDVISPSMPMVKSIIVGGDFNTNPDQIDFVEEKTLTTLAEAGFRSPLDGLPLTERITHPGSGPYPDCTFDYLFGSNLTPGKPEITETPASDHYPVTCTFSFGGGTVAETKPAPKPPTVAKTSPSVAPQKPAATTTGEQFVTITTPVKIKIPYGETTLPRGLKLPIISRDAKSVTVKYLDGAHPVPISATDLQ
jgi:endonuclease/exonuclease/phosphatase family metal-dependent hydrolase